MLTLNLNVNYNGRYLKIDENPNNNFLKLK